MTAIRGLTALGLILAAGAAFAGPEVVDGPGADPACFAPWSEETKYLQWPNRRRVPTASPSSTASSATPGASR